MAEIPVERKSGVPIWAYILGLLALLLLGWLLYEMFDNDDEVTAVRNVNAVATTNYNRGVSDLNTNTVVGTTTMPAAGAITSLAAYAGITDKPALAGRRAELSGVRVERVISDRAFVVGSGANELYVLLDEALNQGVMERRVRVNAGDTVTLGGTMQRTPSAEIASERQRLLTAQEEQAFRNQPVYLHATQINEAQPNEGAS